MPRSLLAMDHHPDPLTLLKSAFSAATFFATVLAGVSTYKFLAWRGEKWVVIASRFAAGVFLGTAMIECLSDSHAVFHNMGFRYPVAFLMACAGYLVAMLAECVLAMFVQMVSQGFFMKPYFKFLGNSRLIKSWYATLSESQTKDCNDIGFQQNRILNKATQFGDSFFLIYILSVFSAVRGAQIACAGTETNAWKGFLSAIFHDIICVISLTSLLLKFTSTFPSSDCLILIIPFSISNPVGVVLTFLHPNNDSTVNLTKENKDSMIANIKSAVVSILDNETANKWFHGTLTGYSSGFLVYLLAHRLLVDGYEMKGSVPGTRFGRFLAVVFGVALIALVNMLGVY